MQESVMGGMDAGGVFGSLFALIVMYVATAWSTQSIANKSGYGSEAWKAWVPIAQTLLQLKIIGRPSWVLALLFVPFANLFAWAVICFGLAKATGKGAGTALLAMFMPVIGFPLLASGEFNGQGYAY